VTVAAHVPKPEWFEALRDVMGISTVVAMLLTWLVQRRYIVRRYEKETELSKLKCFANPTLDMFEGFFRNPTFAGIYTLHLFLIWALPDGVRMRMPALSDVRDRATVLRHFTRGELVLSVVVGLIFTLAGTAVVAVAILTVGFKIFR
jgi:hypothetical protein